MNIEETKYARIEYERRFLVLPNNTWKNFIEPYSKTFKDKYLKGSRLRLRMLTDLENGQQLIKLTKKYESSSPYFQRLNTILLSMDEYQLLYKLEGYEIKKNRYYHNYNGQIFSIDIFEPSSASAVSATLGYCWRSE
jgi:CYTH domain-containing protein